MNNYEKSNKIETVKYNNLSNKEFSTLLKAETLADRKKASQNLIDYLSNKYGIESVPVRVLDRVQDHSTRNGRLASKVYGKYTRIPGVSAVSIIIFNKTAVKKQTVSIKTFVNTLLHEFMHHYDYEVLKLSDSLHTAGFYKRISDLTNKLS